MILRSLLLVLFAALALGCGPSENRACEGCEGADLIECEDTFEKCKNTKGCQRRHVRIDYAEGLCVSPTRIQACQGCMPSDWEMCHQAYDACESSGECTDEDKRTLRQEYALGACTNSE